MIVPTSTPTIITPWIETEVTFTSGVNALHGILTLPNKKPGPYAAVVLISGSESTETGLRGGIANPYLVENARIIVRSGYAVLRYDPPGVGRSTGDHRFEALEDRVDEAMDALNYLQTRSEIHADRIGLWGVSQGGWVIEMAAADHPKEVAFVISVSGSGVSVADQQVWGVEAQSRAAGLSVEDISKATLLARLLIDWQLTEPIYEVLNQESAQKLGDGPWADFFPIVYKRDSMKPEENLMEGIKILESVQDEPWTKALYLKTMYIPQLKLIQPDQLDAVRGAMAQSLLIDPKDFLPKVTCPLLAFFGGDDKLVPAVKSVELYEQYLQKAGNKNFTIYIFKNADHALSGAKLEYLKALDEWLVGLFKSSE